MPSLRILSPKLNTLGGAAVKFGWGGCISWFRAEEFTRDEEPLEELDPEEVEPE